MGVTTRRYEIQPGEVVGHHIAMDPITGKKKWEIPLIEKANSSGMLVTDGGLIFTGTLDGKFIALDEATGKTSGNSRPARASTPRPSRTLTKGGEM